MRPVCRREGRAKHRRRDVEGEYQRGQDRGMRGDEDEVSKESRLRTTNVRTLDIICCSHM